MKLRKSIVIILCIILSLPYMFFHLLFISFIFPVKFTIKDVPYNDERDFLVLEFHGQKNEWIAFGDRTGLFGDINTGVLLDSRGDVTVIVEGVDPREIVSVDLRLGGTFFVVYGTILSKEYVDENYDFHREVHVIRSTDWDILERVNTRNSFRRLFNRRYLTIYDFRWFDHFRYYNDAYELSF